MFGERVEGPRDWLFVYFFCLTVAIVMGQALALAFVLGGYATPWLFLGMLAAMLGVCAVMLFILVGMGIMKASTFWGEDPEYEDRDDPWKKTFVMILAAVVSAIAIPASWMFMI